MAFQVTISVEWLGYTPWLTALMGTFRVTSALPGKVSFSPSRGWISHPNSAVVEQVLAEAQLSNLILDLSPVSSMSVPSFSPGLVHSSVWISFGDSIRACLEQS